MGRRKRVESAKTAEMRRNQGEDRGRGSMGVCSPSRSNNKNSSIQAPSGGGGGSDHVSRRGSFAVRGGDMAREHTSKHLSRNLPRSGSSFRRPHQQQGVGGGPPPNSTLNFIPPSQQYQLHSSHQPYPCAPQQEQQPYPQGMGFPSTAHLMNLSNGQACGNDGSARHHHNGSIQPGEFSGNPLVARLNSRLLFAAGGATQEPQQQHAPYPSSPGYDKNLNWSTRNGQGQPYPRYCGSHSFLPQQFTTVRNLPPLPYVMTPQGMMAPPPLYLLPMQGSPLMAYMPQQQQQQQEHCEHQDKSNREAPLQHNAMNGNVVPASPLAPYGSQQHTLLDRPQVVSPQLTLVRHPSFLAEKSTATRVAPTAAPPTAADPPAAATAAGCILLPRTQSILNRVSSFRKAAQPASKGDQARQEEVHMQQRLYAREQERLRLQQEMHAREAVNKAAREERLHKLLQRQPSRNFAQESTRNAAPRVLMESPKSSRVSSDNASESRPAPPSEPVLALKQASSARSSSTHPTTDVPASSQEPLDHRLPMSVARLHSPAGSHVSRGSLGMAASSSGATAVIAKGKGPSGDASTATAVVDVPAAPAVGAQKLWHRCPSLVLYEIPLRCAKTVTGKGEEQIDCSTFPVRLVGSRLRVIDAAKQTTTEYAIDEIVTHRQGSTFVESKLFQQVGEVLVAGYSASVLSLDSNGLAKPVSAFDSAAWLAKQRLLRNVIGTVKNMQSTYSKEVGSRDFFEAAFSFALVKKVSAKKAAEWNTTNRATSQRGYEVVDLLQTEPTVVQLKMHSSVLFGHRLDGVEYRALRSESEFTKALARAQANANIVLGGLADAVAADPNDEAAAREQTSVFQVVTCVLTHCKAGAVSLQEQMTEPAEAVYKREAESDVISSDDEDDANAFGAFQSHNVPSACSDIIMNCLTCIGAQQSHDLWTAALEHNHGMAPTSLFDTAFGGPAYTVVLASMDPTKVESAETLVTQSAMSMKLHRRPLNGSARRLIRTSKYMTAVLQKKLNRVNCPSGPQQRSWMADICKYAETLDSLRKVLRSVEATRLNVSGSA